MANSWIFIHDSSMIHGSPCHESFHDLIHILEVINSMALFYENLAKMNY